MENKISDRELSKQILNTLDLADYSMIKVDSFKRFRKYLWEFKKETESNKIFVTRIISENKEKGGIIQINRIK